MKRSVEEAKEALERTLDSTLTAEQRAIAADQFLDKEELWVREIAKEIRRLREQQVKLLHLLFWVECSDIIMMKYQNLHYVHNTFENAQRFGKLWLGKFVIFYLVAKYHQTSQNRCAS